MNGVGKPSAVGKRRAFTKPQRIDGVYAAPISYAALVRISLRLADCGENSLMGIGC